MAPDTAAERDEPLRDLCDGFDRCPNPQECSVCREPAPDTAVIIATALRRAYVDIHLILDDQHVSPERLSDTSIALAEALRVVGSSGAEALRAEGLL